MKDRKFNRQKDQRRALIKGLADSLVINESIETTLPKAKAVARYTERLITKAKKGDLSSRRQIVKSLNTLEAAGKLIDELAPKLGGRSSGHLRVKRTGIRRGDDTQLARVSFVDDLKKIVQTNTEKAPKKPAIAVKKPKVATKTPARSTKTTKK
ncbi:MAG: 50S ribosomal protein L17 [Candidatus Saccharimonadales bacterium]